MLTCMSHIFPVQQCCLCFAIGTQYYQFIVFQFSLSHAPSVFTKSTSSYVSHTVLPGHTLLWDTVGSHVEVSIDFAQHCVAESCSDPSKVWFNAEPSETSSASDLLLVSGSYSEYSLAKVFFSTRKTSNSPSQI